MAEAAETAEMAEWPEVSGKGEGSADEDRSSSSLLDLMCAAVANKCRLSPAGQGLVRDKRGCCWWWWG
jgi:hypothetical protein